MATKELSPLAAAAEEEKAKLKQEKKQFKQEQKAQKKEARRRAAEIAKQEEALGEEGGNGLVTFFATVLIVALWIAIVCVVIKMDIGGFGSSVLAPILKDVPVVNKILPDTAPSLTDEPEGEGYGGYSSIQEAVEYIRQLELQLESAQTASKTKDTEIETLKAEILRLQEFEQRQTEFQRIKTEFYEEVVYSDKGPGMEGFMKYFESIDEATAEYLYKQGLAQQEITAEIQDYVSTFSTMKPKKAASVMEEMTDKMDLVVRTLKAMSVEERADIMEAMSDEFAAKIAKLMDPDA